MIIHNIRHEWPEKAGFVLDRPNGPSEYIFLHYFNPVTYIKRSDTTKPNAMFVILAISLNG